MMDNLLNFKNYRIVESNFKINEDFESKIKNTPLIFRLGHGYSTNGSNLTARLGIKVFEDSKKNNYPFEIEIIMEGLFEAPGNQERELKEYLPNALTILFPYLRSAVSTYIATANLNPVIIQPINIIEYLKDFEKSKQ